MNRTTCRFHWSWLIAAIASGAMMTACYWPLGFWPLAWIAPVPLLAAMTQMDDDQAWLYATLTGLLFFTPGDRKSVV